MIQPVFSAVFPADAVGLRITINTSASGAGVGEDVTEFPLLVRLDSRNFDFSRAATGGSDIGFTDASGTKLFHHIERWDGTAQRAEIWVRVPRVKAAADTQSVFLRWGVAGSASAGGVFDTTSGFLGAWNFTQQPSGDRATYLDATYHEHHAAAKNGVGGMAGVISRAVELSDDSQFLQVPGGSRLDPSNAMTLSAWIRGKSFKSANFNVNSIIRRGAVENTVNYQLAIRNSKPVFYLRESDGAGLEAPVVLEKERTYHIAAAWDGAQARIYVDGALVHQAPKILLGSYYAFNTDVFIGGRTGETDGFDGMLDEVRLESVARSAAWLKLSYETQRPDAQALIFNPLLGPDSEDYSQWSRMTRLLFNTTSTGAGVSENVDVFPLLIRLDSTHVDFNQFQAGGADLRFSDPDGTHLPYEIEQWNAAAKTASVWVRVPRVDGNSDTDYIRMHWGKAGALSRSHPWRVFGRADGFEGAWHLAGSLEDASGHLRHGTNKGAQPQTGAIAQGALFNGSEYVDLGQWNAPQGNQLTLYAWFRGESLASQNDPRILSKATAPDEQSHDFLLGVRTGGVGGVPRLRARVRTNTTTAVEATKGLNDGEWYLGALLYDGTAMTLYLNGEAVGSTAKSGALTHNPVAPIWMGANPTDKASPFKGVLDEVRVLNRAVSPAWLKLSYESQRAVTKLVQVEPPPVPPAITTQPEPVRVTDGGVATFTVSATGTAPLVYQWQRNGADIPGATLAEYTLSIAAPADSGAKFRCRVSNAGGAVLSAEALLHVDRKSIGSDTVATPQAVPAGGPFSDSVAVTLTSATVGAQIRYTLDGSAPGPSSALHEKPIVIKSTTTLKAVALKADWVTSPMVSQVFTYRPGRPTATPPPGSFSDSVSVVLSPARPGDTIRFALEGSATTNGFQIYSTPIRLKVTSVIKAFAQAGGVAGDTVSFAYSYSLSTKVSKPSASPGSGWFEDSAVVTLSTATSGAQIRYTLNGSAPSPAGALYARPLVLKDSAVTLRAVAYRDGLIPSDTLEERYMRTPKSIPDSLRAARPVASPASRGFQDSLVITLTSATVGAEIRYTLDGSMPGPLSTLFTKPLILKASTTLHAAAYHAALLPSVTIKEVYTKGALAGVIAPGDSSEPVAGLRVINRSGTTGLKFDAANLPAAVSKGFETAVAGSPATPIVGVVVEPALAGGAVEARLVYVGGVPGVGLYRLDEMGRVERLEDSGSGYLATAPGFYFAARDVHPPRLRLLSDGAQGDTSFALILIEDNVRNLTLYVEESSSPGNRSSLSVSSGDTVRVTFVRSAGAARTLAFAAEGWDGFSKMRYPADSTRWHHLPQSFESLATPLRLRAGYAWDLVSVPVRFPNTPTLEKLFSSDGTPGAAGSALGDLRAAVWRPENRSYAIYSNKQVLPTGSAFWLAGTRDVPNLSLASGVLASTDSSGSFRITLRKGWNPVGNPSLRVLYWPIRRQASPSITGFQSLVAWTSGPGGVDDWSDADSLMPWRGYFVHSEKDTTLELLQKKPSIAVAKSSGVAAPLAFRLREQGRMRPLLLGAHSVAGTAVGAEDEPVLPHPDGRPAVGMVRGEERLITDWVDWAPDGVHTWTLSLDGNATRSISRIELDKVALPSGFELWAVAKARGVSERLQDGSTFSLYGARDTIVVLAGSPVALAKNSQFLAAKAPPERLEARIANPGAQRRLELRLPEAMRVDAVLWDAHGIKVTVFQETSLGAGLHQLELGSETLNRQSKGVRWLVLRLQGESSRHRMILPMTP